jgi:hypothetical protein
VPSRGAAAVLVASLALSSAWYVFKRVIQPNVAAREALVERVLAGSADAPYQYRVLHPLLGHAIEALLPAALGGEWRHGLAYGALCLGCFAGIYGFFHAWLRTLFSPAPALLGVALLALPLPLAVSGYFVEGDFLTLLAFILGLRLMASGADAWLPLVVAVGTLNREQTVYLAVFYAAQLAARGCLGRRGKQAILLACVAAFLLVYLGVRSWYGPHANPYGIAFNVAHNTSPRTLREAVIPLWLSVVAGPATLAALSFRSTTRFFRLAFLALVPYAVLFFLNGILIELAKFLPAFLVLIPMAVQTLTGERPRELPG